MFIPVEEVSINDEIKFEQYLSDEGMNVLFDDIISGKVNPGKKYCCKKQFHQRNYHMLICLQFFQGLSLKEREKKEIIIINNPNQSRTQNDEEER